MKKLIFILFFLPLMCVAQEGATVFEHGLSWTQIKEKAKKEKKYIFVDCFTTWCGPCKYMSNTIFPQPKVGDFFNSKFVNAKIQMDKTKSDNEEVQSWYTEAARFEKEYNIKAYPTFLIFNPNGELVHRIVGGGEADQFIARAKEGLDPQTQYYSLLKKFESAPNNIAVAKSLAKAAESAYDQENQKKAQAAIINSLTEKELFEKENLEMLLKSASSSDTKSYQLISKNRAKIDEIMGPGTVNKTLAMILMNEQVLSKIKQDQNLDINILQDELAQSHADIDMTEMFVRFKPQFYFSKKDWPAFKESVESFLAKTDVAPLQLNSFAWTIFENCDDNSCIEAALTWSEKSLEDDKNNSAFLDTYANLLYKKGDKDNAILTQEKAVATADEDSKQELQVNLDKMKKGEPTW